MYFLDKSFEYESYPCNGCHDFMQKAMNFNDVVIVSVKRRDYRIHFWYMSKDGTIKETMMSGGTIKETEKKC